MNNVEDAYRPKNRGRVRNPISSNTMSGEEPEILAETLEQGHVATQQARFKKPVGYAFAGPQAKRQKEKIAAPLQEKVLEQELPEFEFPASKRKNARKKTEIAMRVRAAKKEKKVSEAEIQVRTGTIEKKLSQPEIQVRTGNLANEVAFELLTGCDVLEAVKALEVDVQESKGNYDPIQESEVQEVRSLGLNNLVFKSPDKHEIQYELDLDSIDIDEFAEAQVMQATERPAEPLVQVKSDADLGLIFEPQNYRNDLKKNQVLSIARQGIKRSNRGTIEAVFQPDGKVVEAQYNRCGILIEVTVAGIMKLTRCPKTGGWAISYCDGSQPVNRVKNVAFDRSGNLCYSTEDGVTTVICADGSIVQK